MSAQLKHIGLARPCVIEDPISRKFMEDDLARSGLLPTDIDAYPIESLALTGTGAYVIPYRDPRMWRVRYDRKNDKYIQPPKQTGVWTSSSQSPESFRRSPVVYIVEGEKKAAKFVKTWPHLPTFGIGGAHMSLEKLDDGRRKFLDDIQEVLAPHKTIVAIFDGDITTKVGIQQAAYNLHIVGTGLGCIVKVYKPPAGKGVDDWLVENPTASLDELVELNVSDLEISRKNLYKALGLHLNDKERPVPNDLNIKKLLTHYFSERVYMDRRLGFICDGRHANITELEIEAIAYIQGEHMAHAARTTILAALHHTLADSKADLVQDLVRSLKWDGFPRLETWGSKYLDSMIPAYANEWGRILMTGLGLRILEPGMKFDYVPIMVGAQGIGKTTFFEELSQFDGEKFYHACLHISIDQGDGNRTQCIAWHKSLVVDIGEGALLEGRRSTLERAKQRITQSEDEWRPLYASSSVISKRAFIFVGTTNKTDQLNDSSGSRRFLPITVTKITKLPYDEKLQILAEIVAREQELRQSNWYQLRTTLDDVPLELRESAPHITSVQELLNTQYHRKNDVEDFLVRLLDSPDEVARLSDDSLYITAGYITSRLNAMGERQTKNFVSRIISSLASSPTFPYTLEVSRKRLNQLVIHPQYLAMYMDGINNNQQMINGYRVTPKVAS